MTEYTVGMLKAALQRVPIKNPNATVRAVVKAQFVERGPLEGCYAIDHVAVVGLAFTNDGLIIFLDQAHRKDAQSAMPPLPAQFETGNPELDALRRQQDEEENSGEDWKKG